MSMGRLSRCRVVDTTNPNPTHLFHIHTYLLAFPRNWHNRVISCYTDVVDRGPDNVQISLQLNYLNDNGVKTRRH